MSETVAQAQTSSQAIVNLAAISLSAAPDLTEAERTNRFQTVVRGAAEFQPADTAQTILASLILGHHLTIMDGFRDLARLTLTPAEVARARSVAVAETKLVLQLLREMRIERADAVTRAAPDGGEPAQKAVGEAAYDAALGNLLSTYTDTLATLESSDTLTPAAAARAWEALNQATPSSAAAIPHQATPITGAVTGSRAQRRAQMKRNGAFKRNA
jgi:hypothetical protein